MRLRNLLTASGPEWGAGAADAGAWGGPGGAGGGCPPASGGAADLILWVPDGLAGVGVEAGMKDRCTVNRQQPLLGAGSLHFQQTRLTLDLEMDLELP